MSPLKNPEGKKQMHKEHLKYEEYLKEAEEELKRADHLIYVTLKYTRTADVIRNIIKRLVNFYDNAIISLLEYAKSKEIITSVPANPVQRGEALINLYPADDKIKANMETYFLMRKLLRAKIKGQGEYRKTVTMIAAMGEETVNINMEIINKYYEDAKEFYIYIIDLIKGKEQ